MLVPARGRKPFRRHPPPRYPVLQGSVVTRSRLGVTPRPSGRALAACGPTADRNLVGRGRPLGGSRLAAPFTVALPQRAAGPLGTVAAVKQRQRRRLRLVAPGLVAVAVVSVVDAVRGGRSFAQVMGEVALRLGLFAVACLVVSLIVWEATTPDDGPGDGGRSDR